MISLLKRKKNDDINSDMFTYLALDIGTEFIKTALFMVKNGKADVIGFSRVAQHSRAMEGAMIININNVVSSCDIGIGRAIAEANKLLGERCVQPKLVTLGISGELVKGVSIVANYEREEPDKPIDSEELEIVVSGIKEQAFPDSIEDIAAEIGSSPDKIKEINTHINATYIDGNKVDNPIGFTGREVSYKVYSTFAPAIHINSLYEIAKRLNLEILTIDVPPYAVSKSYRGSYKTDFSSIFLDIGGGTTDVALVEQGAIIGTQMYAFGGRVFSKRLSDNLKIELHEAEKLKLDYSHNKVKDLTVKKIKEALKDDIKVWTEGLELTLAEYIEDIDSFPTQVLMCGGGSELPDIYDSLIEYPWLATLPFEKFPDFKHIYPNQIVNVEDRTGTMITTTDVVCAALVSISIPEIEEILNFSE